MGANPTTPLGPLAGLTAAATHDAREAAPAITAPTLVLAGERDALVGPEVGQDVLAAIPGARFEVVVDAGHDVTLEQPTRSATLVARFLRAHAKLVG